MKRTRQARLNFSSYALAPTSKKQGREELSSKRMESPKFSECRRLLDNIKHIMENRRSNKKSIVPISKGYKMNQDGSSWIIHAKEYMKSSDLISFEKLWDMHPKERKYIGILYGKPAFENRFSQSYGVSYNYSGYKEATGTQCPITDDPILTNLIDEIGKIVDECRGPYNGCLTNWYLPEHYLSPHADDEKQLKPDDPIFSLSWGGPRRFVVKPKKGQEMCCSEVDILVGDGDLVVMGGSLQKTHNHEIPRWRKTKDTQTNKRINWTVRAFKY